MIPMELIPLISSQLVERPRRSPTWFELPPSYFLNRATEICTTHSAAAAAPPANQSTSDLCTSTSVCTTNVVATWSSVSTFPAATNLQKTVKFANFLWGTSTFRRAVSTSTANIKREMLNRDAPSATRTDKESKVPAALQTQTAHRAKSAHSAMLTAEYPFKRSLSAPPAIEGEALPVAPCSGITSDHRTPSSTSIPELPSRAVPPNTFTLGNLYISSCPGKKGVQFCSCDYHLLCANYRCSQTHWTNKRPRRCLQRPRAGPATDEEPGCRVHRLVRVSVNE